MNFPELRPVNRDREYKQCSEEIRDKVIFLYLFEGQSHRWLDENIISIRSSYSRGWMSMGILHYLGLIDSHKGIFSGKDIIDVINLLSKEDSQKYKHIILALMRYSQNIYQDNTLEAFTPPPEAPILHKLVGTSQYTDGVRIDKEFHSIFNPEGTLYYVSRSNARKVKVLFNNKVFDAEYRYEGQTDGSIVLQSIRFRKELKEEFQKVFPEPIGEFTIQQGIDLNHFAFSHKVSNFIDNAYEDENEYPEGKEAFRNHRIRERNPEVIIRAKERFKRLNGHLYCEVCKFDFEKVYGDRGIDFIEGHHKKLVSEMKEGEKTKVEDIAMLCSNCHRMIHKKPMITVEDLTQILKLL